MLPHTARRLVRLIAWGRIGIGVMALLTPERMAEPWVGELARSPSARVLSRAMGGRDLAIGVGCLRALIRSDEEALSWVALGGMADAVDTVATLMALGHLHPARRWLVLALTAGAATSSFWAASSLDAFRPDIRG